MPEYISADGYPIREDEKFWDKNLRVVAVTHVATDSNPYPEMGTQTWHRTTGGLADSFAGNDAQWGGLAKREPFTRKSADDYETGTNYADIK